MIRVFALLVAVVSVVGAKTILVVTADASDYVLAAGGTIGSMIERGDRAILLRVTNDDKDSWNLVPEETARRTREESEAAAKILGIEKVIALGYRGGELGGVSPTELRDRILFYIRLHKPDVLFIPNPYTHYSEVLDRFYTGQAAEEARRAASLRNHQPPLAATGLEPHLTPEIYYYAQPFDPRRREAESTATFAPQPMIADIAGVFAKKVRAAQALKTIQYATAMRIKQRLESSGRRLPLLDQVNDQTVAQLVEINVRGLGEIAAKDSKFQLAEEFQYAGREYQIPAKLR